MPRSTRNSMRRGIDSPIRAVLGGLVAAAIGCVVLVAVTRGSTSPAQAVANASPPRPSRITATVELAHLIDVVPISGTIESESIVRPVPPADGFGGAVVTAVPAPTGSGVVEGQVLTAVNGRPILAMIAAVPFYRDLKLGSSGGDVEELQQSLQRLGMEVPQTSTFDRATQAALTAVYRGRGYEPPRIESDSATEGPATDVPASTEALAVAELALAKAREAWNAGRTSARQAVERAKAALDVARRGGEAAEADAERTLADAISALRSAPLDPNEQAAARAAADLASQRLSDARSAAQAAVSDAESALRAANDAVAAADQPPDTRAESLAVAAAERGAAAARSLAEQTDEVGRTTFSYREVLALESDRTVVRDPVARGAVLGAGESPITVAMGASVMHASVSLSVAALVKPAQRVEVAGIGNGRVREVVLAQTADASGIGLGATPGAATAGAPSAGAGATVIVDLDPAPDPQAAGQSVNARIVLAESEGKVPSLPISAVVATDVGSYAVVDDRTGRRIRVEVGLNAGGTVEVRGIPVGTEVRVRGG